MVALRLDLLKRQISSVFLCKILHWAPALLRADGSKHRPLIELNHLIAIVYVVFAPIYTTAAERLILEANMLTYQTDTQKL
jgi:hypothetical protein